MSATKPEVPAAPGWVSGTRDEAHLVGTRCKACGTYYFPKETTFCRSPICEGTEFEEVELSRRGTLWSFTSNGYEPPAPYVSPTKPFEPFAIAAVELEREKLVVLGMVVAPLQCADLRVGMEMELVLDTLFETETERQIVWKWRPVKG
ncbi:MAG: OB-fold domain-containing protein [Polyangiaceae bacterium]|nr:OB-fold domain-containing protein [Polyangiaceae bacterium]